MHHANSDIRDTGLGAHIHLRKKAIQLRLLTDVKNHFERKID